MHHVLAIINHRSTFVFVAVNAMRQGFFSIVPLLSLIIQALNSEVRVRNSEGLAFISEVRVRNSEHQAFFSIRRVRRLRNLNFAQKRLIFHSMHPCQLKMHHVRGLTLATPVEH